MHKLWRLGHEYLWGPFCLPHFPSEISYMTRLPAFPCLTQYCTVEPSQRSNGRREVTGLRVGKEENSLFTDDKVRHVETSKESTNIRISK